MSDFDLDRLGDVWRQQPDAAELERLRRTAVKVARRARWGRIVDIVATVAITSVVLLLVWSNPQKNTIVVGLATIVLLLLGQRRQRRLRQVELRNLTGDTEEMIAQSIERIETTIRHNRLTLIGLGPIVLLAMIFAATTDRGSDAVLASLRDQPWFRFVWYGVWIAAVAGFVVFTLLAIRRGRREVERLTAMRDSYHQERKSAVPH